MPRRRYATVTATRQEDGTVTFTWEGSKKLPLAISHALLDMEPDLLDRLPWKLRKTGEDWLADADIFKRED